MEQDSAQPELDQITPPHLPAGNGDSSAQKEEDWLALTATKQLPYVQRELKRALQSRIESQQAQVATLTSEVQQLRRSEVELARFQTSDRFYKVLLIVCALGGGLGALLLESSDQQYRIAGRCLVIFALVIQAIVGLFNPRV